MKKIFFICTFLLMTSVTINNAAKAESVLEPQWAEFCPPLYENAVFKPAKENSKRNMENNYWALRKAKFDKSIAECKALSKSTKDLGVCYARVANLERNKNSQRQKARAEKDMDTRNQIYDGGYWWY